MFKRKTVLREFKKYTFLFLSLIDKNEKLVKNNLVLVIKDLLCIWVLLYFFSPWF